MHYSKCSVPAALILAALLGMAGPAAAQEYPSRPVKFLIPYAPGSTLELAVRAVAHHWETRTGQAAIVDYKAGAAALVGAQVVLNEPADGYTLFTPGPSPVTWKIFNKETGIDFKRDFIPVTNFYTVPYLLTTNTQTPTATLAEFIAYARANPGKFNYGTVGGAMTLNIERFTRMAGIKVVQVPYKSGSDTRPALLSNLIQLTLDNDQFYTNELRNGRVRILAVTGKQRIPKLPNVPTVGEAGVPGYLAGSWTGIFVKSGTPDAVVNKIYAIAHDAMGTQEYRDVLEKLGVGNIVGGTPPAEWARQLDAEMKGYEEVAVSLGLLNQ